MSPEQATRADAELGLTLSGIRVPASESKMDALVADLHDELEAWVDDLDRDDVVVEDGFLRVDLAREGHYTAAADEL